MGLADRDHPDRHVRIAGRNILARERNGLARTRHYRGFGDARYCRRLRNVRGDTHANAGRHADCIQTLQNLRTSFQFRRHLQSAQTYRIGGNEYAWICRIHHRRWNVSKTSNLQMLKTRARGQELAGAGAAWIEEIEPHRSAGPGHSRQDEVAINGGIPAVKWKARHNDLAAIGIVDPRYDLIATRRNHPRVNRKGTDGR